RASGVQEDDVTELVLLHEIAQNRHDGCYSAPAADEEQFSRRRARQDEIARRFSEREHVARLQMIVQPRRDASAGYTLDRDRTASATRSGRKGVAASVSHAVDFDLDGHELAGTEARPTAIRHQDEGLDVVCFVDDVDDTRPQLFQRPNGIQLAQPKLELAVEREPPRDRVHGTDAGTSQATL